MELTTLFRTIMDSLREVVLVRDAGGDLVYCSPALTRLFGYAPEEIGGPEELLGLIHPDDLSAFLEATRRCYEEGAEFDLEFRGRRRDGAYVWIQNRAYWADGNRTHLVGIFHDVTERKTAEDELCRARDELEARVRERTAELEGAKAALEADVAARVRAEAQRDRLERELRRSQTLEAVGRLAGGVAHDFNNLLGSILGCLYVARGELATDPAEASAELDRVQQLCRRGGELTRQLLAVARRPAGLVESIALPELIEEARVLLERALPPSIRLTCAVDSGLPRVRGDRSLLAAALLNLGLNARDAMPRGGSLTVAACREPDGAILTVADTGIGMPPEVRDRVFEPFFTTKPADQGTGLGLAMVYATVTESGGEITVESAPGTGTTFRIRLPKDNRLRAPSAARPREGAHPLTAGHVLVVEDEEDVARMAVAALTQRGYRVLRAATGLEALKAVRDHREAVALVTLDLMLPELGGEEVFRSLRALAPDLPVLFATGREDLARTLAPDAPLLPKPFDDEDLLAAVAEALDAGA